MNTNTQRKQKKIQGDVQMTETSVTHKGALEDMSARGSAGVRTVRRCIITSDTQHGKVRITDCDQEIYYLVILTASKEQNGYGRKIYLAKDTQHTVCAFI